MLATSNTSYSTRRSYCTVYSRAGTSAASATSATPTCRISAPWLMDTPLIEPCSTQSAHSPPRAAMVSDLVLSQAHDNSIGGLYGSCLDGKGGAKHVVVARMVRHAQLHTHQAQALSPCSRWPTYKGHHVRKLLFGLHQASDKGGCLAPAGPCLCAIQHAHPPAVGA